MSSHHFVTERQSTALYIAGQNIEPVILNQLLEWNPLIIANSKTSDWLQALNVKIDYLIGESSELPYKCEQWPQSEIWQRLNSIFELQKADRLVIAGTGEADTQLMWDQWFDHRNYAQVLYAGNLKYFPILKGQRFKKWVRKGYTFCIDNAVNANIEGDVEKVENKFSMRSEGWIIVKALSDVLFGEYQ